MPKLMNDPLLSGTRAGILLVQAVTLVVAAGLLIGIPIAWLFRERILEQIGPGALGEPSVIWAILAILFLSAAVLGLGFWFLQEIRRIIDTVRDGDPFVPRNADRLRRMGWLSLATFGTSFVVAPLGIWLLDVGDWENAPEAGSGFPIGGLVLAIVLFVLARVFRKGAEMRDDLEGTV